LNCSKNIQSVNWLKLKEKKILQPDASEKSQASVDDKKTEILLAK